MRQESILTTNIVSEDPEKILMDKLNYKLEEAMPTGA
jgi:hypothetical protein